MTLSCATDGTNAGLFQVDSAVLQCHCIML